MAISELGLTVFCINGLDTIAYEKHEGMIMIPRLVRYIQCKYSWLHITHLPLQVNCMVRKHNLRVMHQVLSELQYNYMTSKIERSAKVRPSHSMRSLCNCNGGIITIDPGQTQVVHLLVIHQKTQII